MELTVIVAFAAIGAALNRFIQSRMKKSFTERLTSAIQNQNEAEYHNLIFSRRAKILMEPDAVELARASVYSHRGDCIRSQKALDSIHRPALSISQQAFYYTLRLNLAVTQKQETEYSRVQEELRILCRKTNASALEAVYQNSVLQGKLNFTLDPTVIDDLKSALKSAQGKERGWLTLMLAQAYRQHHQDEEAEVCRRQAAALLKEKAFWNAESPVKL